MKAEPDETRAEIARRRLSQLAASFDSQLPAVDEPVAVRPRPEVPYVRAVAAVAVAASVLLVWWLLAGRPKTSDPVAPLTVPTATVAASDKAPTPELIIDVVGTVRRPGIVTLPKGSRVYEAIEAAGGLKGKVDTTTLNLARELTDGEQVIVGIEPVEGFDPAASPAGAGPAQAKVNLNSATAEQLDALPGVGPVTAQSILNWRQDNGRFSTVDDLLDVKGIGEATLAELRDLVTV